MNEKLREILKRGDPAAGEPGLSAEEVQGMRRVVLAAVPEPRRRGWLVPALAGAAALILAAVIALSLWQPQKPEQVVAVRPPAARPPLPPPKASPPAARERKLASAPEKKEKKPVRRAPEPEPVVLARAEPPASPDASGEQRQIQFSTPGGTRVIWVLHPATE